jgi:hypothetical protein
MVGREGRAAHIMVEKKQSGSIIGRSQSKI